MKDGLLADLVRALDQKRAVVLGTRIPGGQQALLFPMEADTPEPEGWPLEAARQALLDDRATTLAEGEGAVFLRPYNPPVRMVVVGAVHIAAPLTVMATAAGFEVHVVDPRAAWATDARFPDVHLVRSWPQEAFAELRLDHRTAVVALTHDAKLDDPALLGAMASPCFYVGALGSRKTHARRLERLREAGVDEAGVARIHAPIGLDIGARTPAEIAVAILAEVVARLRGGAAA